MPRIAAASVWSHPSPPLIRRGLASVISQYCSGRMLYQAAGVPPRRKGLFMDHEDTARPHHIDVVAMSNATSQLPDWLLSGGQPAAARKRERDKVVKPRRVPAIVPRPTAANYRLPRPDESDSTWAALSHLSKVAACRSRRAAFLAELRTVTPLGQRHALMKIARETQERCPNPNRLERHFALIHARLESIEEIIAVRAHRLPPGDSDAAGAEPERLWLLAQGLVQLNATRGRREEAGGYWPRRPHS